MATPHLVMYDGEFQKVNETLSRLHAEAKAKAVYLVDRNGQLIASHGDTMGMDTTSLASLTAGNVAATGGLAKLIGEKEFTILFHEGERDNLHITIVGSRVILLVIFDDRSSLGLVRLRVKKTSEELVQIFEGLAKRAEEEKGAAKELFDTHFAEISDEDIDKLFKD